MMDGTIPTSSATGDPSYWALKPFAIRWLRGSLGDKYQRPDTIKPDKYTKELDKLVTNFPIKTGAIIIGTVGCGKTTLLSHIGARYIGELEQRGLKYADYPIFYATHNTLLRDLKDMEINKQSIGDTIYKRGILLIDDYGRGFDDKAGFSLSLQEDFFDKLWSSNRRIFVTSNFTPEQLRKIPGHERIADRLLDPNWLKLIKISEGTRRK